MTSSACNAPLEIAAANNNKVLIASYVEANGGAIPCLTVPVQAVWRWRDRPLAAFGLSRFANARQRAYLTVPTSEANSYNRILRLAASVLAILTLAACHRAPGADAVRQAVIDRLSQGGFPLNSMDVKVTALETHGNEADATVSISLKDAKDAPPMILKYRVQQQGSKWVVLARQDSGSGHGAVAPGADTPHAGGGAMPSPEDLPPAGKKK